MNYEEVMSELRNMGTEQNVKVYKRHGAGDDVHGVSFANLNKLKKRIKVDHELALELWNSGNVDARTLATMVADPAMLTPSIVNRWMNNVHYYVLADLLAALVSRTNFAAKKMEQWMRSRKEYHRQSGYSILSSSLKDGALITDDDCRRYLDIIGKEIHDSPNRARHTMNQALIAIGIYRPALTREAIAIAKRIGRVEVDHGETSCKTPDAVSYIRKALKRKKK